MGDEKKKQEHKLWIKEEFEETEREKRKLQQFYKSKMKRVGFTDKAMVEGKMIHGVMGKPGRKGRGSKR